MSDSSEDEDLSRFKEAVDNSFVNSLDTTKSHSVPKPQKSERYLEEASHYNDVKVPVEMQKKIAAKLSRLIEKKIEFVTVEDAKAKKRKIKGGIKLFKDSEDYLSCEPVKDTYTEIHNKLSKKIKNEVKKKRIEPDGMSEEEKLKCVTVSPEHVLSKKDTQYWKSRRKEKLFKYKTTANSKVMTAVD